MRRSSVIVSFLVVAAAACRNAPERPPGPQSLTELAAAWSGGRTDPTCRNRGPHGEFLGSVPGVQYCQWPTVVRGEAWGTVGGQRDALSGFGMITWERRFTARDEIAALADSLDRELRARGLREYTCERGMRRWETKNLAVAFMPPHDPTDTVPRAIVVATILPRALDDSFCAAPPPERPSTNM